MNNGEMLQILKHDLQLTTTANDDYLVKLLEASKKLIEREGVTLENTGIEGDLIVCHYAAYLFRKRASSETAMPKFLRRELNNLLLSQKGEIDSDNI